MTAEHAPRILYQVKQVELAVRGRLDAVVRPHGITVTQYTALTVLEQHPGMSSAQLARHAFVSAQAMEGIVRALAEAGLIERARDADNRRRMTISLTPAGTALLAACRERRRPHRGRGVRGTVVRRALGARAMAAGCPAGAGGFALTR